MAKAWKCDRCGKFYEPYDGIGLIEKGNKYDKIIFSSTKTNWNWEDKVLCPDCMEKLIKFINDGVFEQLKNTTKANCKIL